MEKVCDNCKNLLEKDFEFCPYCSNPITEKAKELDEKRIVNAELVLLLTMLKEANDEKTLKILNKYIKLLSKEK